MKFHTKDIPKLGALKYARAESTEYYYTFDVSNIIKSRADKSFYEQFGTQHITIHDYNLLTDRAMMKWLTNPCTILNEHEQLSIYHVFIRILSCWQPKKQKEKPTPDNTVKEFIDWRAKLSQQEPMSNRLEKLKNPFQYVDRFIRNEKLHPLLKYSIFPNIKEISESLAAYYAIKTCLEKTVGRQAFGDENVNCYVVADGSMPRTGGVLVLLTNWRVYSIDPAMKNTITNQFDKLSCHTCTAEEFDIPQAKQGVLSVVVAVHSHADFNAFWNRIPTPKLGIAIPCCLEQYCDNLDCLEEYEDDHILSAAKHIKMWYQEKAM
jgi:hypothetical protein